MYNVTLRKYKPGQYECSCDDPHAVDHIQEFV